PREDLLRDRSRVLGVGVDLAREESVPEDTGPAELTAMLGARPRAPRKLSRDFTDDHRLGEDLRSDLDVRLRSRAGRRREGRHEQHRAKGYANGRNPGTEGSSTR